MKILGLLLVLTCIVVGISTAQTFPSGTEETLPRTNNMTLGLGVMVGNPLNLNAKYWVNDWQAIVGEVAWNQGGFTPARGLVPAEDTRFMVQAEYLWHMPEFITGSNNFPISYGFGARYDEGGTYPSAISVLGVAGLSYIPGNLPLDIFAQITPLLQLNRDTRFGLLGGIGARYYIF